MAVTVQLPKRCLKKDNLTQTSDYTLTPIRSECNDDANELKQTTAAECF